MSQVRLLTTSSRSLQSWFVQLTVFFVSLIGLGVWQHEYKFEVVMTCSGCSGAVSKVLSKLDENQTVVVKGSAPYQTVLEKIKKTGKEVKHAEVVN
ncbi:related to ATX1 - antioxidant protein and metal homeostasis factor [Ustilago bromivora]|uniref:Related to ATX1 - antioxidant protein and metal homeostasis factor n=1 Tax=Ustilago bromivora TaxID=307758 RepID=A0A8H8QK11_9BASI|nr:related to ATX1 - antioxidant protein and metal homeostasis factor [Ustilago bromivora]